MPSGDLPTDVLIVGAGVSGRVAARHLGRSGLLVRLVDKGRGGCGRSATRSTEALSFDHGAQYFTIREPSHLAWLQRARERGSVAEWKPRLGEHDGERTIAKEESELARYVAVPGMSALGEALDDGCGMEPLFSHRVEAVHYEGGLFSVQVFDHQADAQRVYQARSLICTAPPMQTAQLLATVSKSVANDCAAAEALPTWALGIAFDRRLDVDLDAIFINGGPLEGGFAARDSSKPGRDPTKDVWVLHAGSAFSARHLERSPEAMIDLLTEGLQSVLGLATLPKAVAAQSHRWRYARPAEAKAANPPHLLDAATPMAVAGDWLAGGRVEGAMTSGRSAADALVERLRR